MSYSSKTFRDPVHGNLSVERGLQLELVESCEFQRLRHIRQLGMCFTTFHGAEHSRFQHALGVSHLARQVLAKWEELPECSGLISPIERQATLAAALLHDIGHGPFSHALERVFTGLSHESIGWNVICNQLSPILRAHDVEPEMVVAILQGSYSKPFLHELVSGPVDVDRMDYLLRDSLYTGVKYGLFDSERILNCLVPLRERESGRWVLALRRKGVEAVEEFLFSRYFMYWQVYFHGTVRAAEVLLRLTLERARELWFSERRPELPAQLEFLFAASTESGQLSLEFEGAEEDSTLRFCQAFLQLDDADIFYALKLWQRSGDPVLADLARRSRDRRLFKVAPRPDDAARLEAARDVVKKVYGEHHRYYFCEDQPAQHKRQALAGEAPGGSVTPLRVIGPEGQWSELSRVTRSQAVAALEGSQSSGYIFYPQDCRSEIERILQSD